MKILIASLIITILPLMISVGKADSGQKTYEQVCSVCPNSGVRWRQK